MHPNRERGRMVMATPQPPADFEPMLTTSPRSLEFRRGG